MERPLIQQSTAAERNAQSDIYYGEYVVAPGIHRDPAFLGLGLLGKVDAPVGIALAGILSLVAIVMGVVVTAGAGR